MDLDQLTANERFALASDPGTDAAALTNLARWDILRQTVAANPSAPSELRERIYQNLPHPRPVTVTEPTRTGVPSHAPAGTELLTSSKYVGEEKGAGRGMTILGSVLAFIVLLWGGAGVYESSFPLFIGLAITGMVLIALGRVAARKANGR